MVKTETLGGTIRQAYQEKVAGRTIRWDYQVGLPFGCKSGGIQREDQEVLIFGYKDLGIRQD